MCFVIDDDRPDIILAEEDRVCYKFMHYINGGVQSPFRYFSYRFNELYTCGPLVPDNLDKIHEGFHSYTKLRVAMEESLLHTVVAKCIIPKGSTYYVNDYADEYVSDNIIIKEILYYNGC